MGARAGAWRFGVWIAVVVAIVGASTMLGPTPLDWGAVFAGGVGERDAGAPASIFWRLRVPRALLAAVAGAGLAVGGVIFQILFRNPLAEPYTLGVASGAAVAAACGFLCGWTGLVAGVPKLTLLAFGGALAALGAVYLLSRLRAERDVTRLLLGGVCVAYLCSAGVLLVTFLADRAVTNDIVTWMMGSLSTLRPRAPLEIAIVLAPAWLLLAAQHRALDLLAFGDALAGARGVAVGRTTWGCFAVVGLLTAAIVSNCGPIGFVGLMVPHLARPIFGGRSLPLLAGAALLGAAFLAVCDGVARACFIIELPVGVVTNFLGAGFFFYLLASGAELGRSARQ